MLSKYASKRLKSMFLFSENVFFATSCLRKPKSRFSIKY